MSYYIHDPCCMTGPSRTRYANILDALKMFAAFYRTAWLMSDDGEAKRRVASPQKEGPTTDGLMYVRINPYAPDIAEEQTEKELVELRVAAAEIGFGVRNPYSAYRGDRSKFWAVKPNYQTYDEYDAWTRPLARKINAEALARRKA